MRRWRRAAPPQFEFAVVAPPNVGRLKAGAALENELHAMLAAATLLESRVLVVPTPVEVTPSKVWRDRLAKLLDRLPREERTIVWEPSGVWEQEEAAHHATKWGTVLGVDPSRDEVPAGAVVYGRLRAAGAVRSFSRAALEKVAEAIGGERRDAYVVVETAGALKEAKMLRQLVRGSKSGSAHDSKSAGFATLVRPRGMLAIPNDEQDE